MGGHGQKWVRPIRSWDSKVDVLSRLTEWCLDTDSDKLIFGLIANTLGIFDI